MMKNVRFIVVAAGLLSLAAMSVQAAPINGTYMSTELGGTVIDGRWSEAWADGEQGKVGSTVSAASWNGATLGTMWEIVGPAIDATPTLDSTVVAGNLTIQTWSTTYSGGSLYLKNTGSWWDVLDPGTQYALTVGYYSHTTTKSFYLGDLQDVRTLVHFNATFDDFSGSSVDFVISTAITLDAGATPPANYPPFAINTSAGAWGNAQKIKMEIVPEPATLAILGLGGLLLRRRIA